MPNAIPHLNGNGRFDEDMPLLSEFIQQTDEARAVVRPSNIGKFYFEDEVEAAEEEQLHAYEKKAAEEAREPDKEAAALAHEADKATIVSDDNHTHLAASRKRLERDEAVLEPHSRRSTDAKWLKWVRWAGILGGDIAGISGAALLLGELPINAFMQATSAAVSAVTLGAVGREVRYRMAARTRQKAPDELSDEERQYASWFAGPNNAEALVKIIVLACATGMVLIAGGIFALRDVAEGLGPALTFGCFALALGLASFYNSFDTADDIAEHLDAQVARVKRLDKAAEKVRKDRVIKQRAGAKAAADSIRTANAKAGEAAAAGLRRSLYQTLGHSPGVAGNGTPPKRNNHRKRGESGSRNGRGRLEDS